MALLSSVFNDGLRTREGQLYFTLMGFVLISNVIAYFLFYGAAALRNQAWRERPWSKRLAGTIGVVLFTGVAGYFLAQALDHQLLRSVTTPLSAKIEHLATVFAIPLLPALLVLAVSGVKAMAATRPD
ncbi:MAG TPA: hypothetical protein VG900_09330 [Hyphomicrobiaceae bacterium]|jgi:hypothetical protein|nr:hypothetical protein [Hyphomicrobiaceae bacterium]